MTGWFVSRSRNDVNPDFLALDQSNLHVLLALDRITLVEDKPGMVFCKTSLSGDGLEFVSEIDVELGSRFRGMPAGFWLLGAECLLINLPRFIDLIITRDSSHNIRGYFIATEEPEEEQGYEV